MSFCHSFTLRSAVSVSALSLLLSGCGGRIEPATPTSLVLHGTMHGGQQPVAGATVQLYTVSTSGDGTASKALLTSTVTTDGNGGFTLSPGNSPLYSCTGATEVYLTGTGGNPGLGTGGSNPNLAMMVALGPCSGLTTSTSIQMNELTTVAAVSAMANYMTSQTAVGASTYDAGALAADFTLAAELVNPSTGAAPGSNVPSGYTVPNDLIATIGNILAACINSSGVQSGQTTPCGQLFTYATPTGGTVPANTLAAMLDIANHPTANTTPLYGLIGTTPPFPSAIGTAPASYQVALLPAAFTVTRSFYAFPESDNSVTPLYTLINNARTSIDMTMYELVDTTFSGDLVSACARGVKVRVILDQNDEKSSNTAAYNQLNGQTNCSAAWANPQFQVTHEKSFILDGSTLALLSLNLTSRYYSTTRDFALIENDPNDIAAVEATFVADFGSTNDFSYVPSSGDSLIWSPTTAQADLIAIINNATSTLLVENEEMSASNIVTALENACKRGVTVHIAMTDTGSYHSEYTALEAAGCGVHTYVDNSTTLYIHAKAILADYGTPAVVSYMGSINFSIDSMTENRELGAYITDSTSQTALYNTITSDYAGAPAY